MSMKLDVYHFDPTQGTKELIQTFVINKNGEAEPTMPGDTSWAESARGRWGKIYTDKDGEAFLEALQEKLNSTTYLVAQLH